MKEFAIFSYSCQRAALVAALSFLRAEGSFIPIRWSASGETTERRAGSLTCESADNLLTIGTNDVFSLRALHFEVFGQLLGKYSLRFT